MKAYNAIQTIKEIQLFVDMEKEEEKLVAYARFCFLWRYAKQYGK